MLRRVEINRMHIYCEEISSITLEIGGKDISFYKLNKKIQKTNGNHSKIMQINKMRFTINFQ